METQKLTSPRFNYSWRRCTECHQEFKSKKAPMCHTCIMRLRARADTLKRLKFEKPKKITKKTLKRKADTLFSLYIRRNNACQLRDKDGIRCGGYLQCAHIETRGVLAIRWSPENALCLCGGHHWYYTNHESKWQEIVKKEFPKQYEFYIKHKNDVWDGDYETVIERLKKLSKEAKL